MHICINNKNEWMNKNETDQKKKKFLEGCDYCRIFWKVDDRQPLLLLFHLLCSMSLTPCPAVVSMCISQRACLAGLSPLRVWSACDQRAHQTFSSLT